MTVVTINPGDGAPDVAALINATLADPAVTQVILGEGVFLIHSPITIPSGKTLSGAGRDLTIIRAAEDFDRPNPGEYDGVVNTNLGATDVTLADFSIDANKLMPDGFRLHGCFMRQATNFTIERVDVYNTSGYAHFAQGDANHFTRYASGTYEDCATYNASIGFEQMAADGITLTNIFAGDGDGDMVGTYFHPLTGSRNITYINAVAYGYGDIGFELTANVRAMDNIRIIDSRVEMLGGGSALVVAGNLLTTGLELVNSTFIAHNNLAAMFYGTEGTAVDTYFQGEAIGVAFFTSPGGFASNFVATDSNVLGLKNTVGNAAAFGVGTSAAGVEWHGGSIEARGPAMNPLSGPVALSGTTLIRDGYDSISNYVENGAASRIAPALAVSLASLGALAGGSVTVTYLAKNMLEDQLGIQNQGIGDNQIGFDGANVTYEGVVIGTATGGAAGEDMVIALNASATAEAVQALVRAVTFSSGANNPLPYRPFEFHIADGVGGAVEADAIVTVTPINDGPTLALYAAGAPPFVNYVENAAPAALVPSAVLSDIDSLDFNTGSLKVELSANATTADRLSILHQGTGAGQIGVAGTTVTYGGIAVGTFTGGTGGSTPLLVTFNANASQAAVQALTRAVAFSNVSDTPSTAARTVKFTATDGDGGSITVTGKAYVLRVDDAPVGGSDSASTGENGTTTGNVLGNDSDVDGPSPQVMQVNGSAANVGQVVTLASGATVQLNADGTYVYNPNGAFEGLGVSGSAAPTSGTDSFTYGLGGGSTATVTVTIGGANDAPTMALGLMGAQANVVIVENAAPAAIAPNAVVADVDSTNFNTGTLTVQFTANGTAADRLSILNQGNGAGQIGVAGNGVSYGGVAIGTFTGGTSGSTPLVVTLNASASVAAVGALTRSIAFGNVSEAPSTATRTLSFTLTDGDGGSVQAIAKSSVLETDDVAVAKNDNFSTSEGQAILGDVFADNGNGPDGDVDGPAIQVGQVNGSAAAVGNQIILPSGALLTLRADGTFDYDPNGLGSGLDSFTYRLASGNIATVTVTNQGVNDAPTLTLGLMGAEANVVIAENDPPAAIAPDAVVADVDSPNFDTGTLTVQFTANGTAADRLSILDQGNGAGQIGVAGNTVSYGGVAIGTFAGGTDGSTPLVVALNASATIAAVEALTRSIAFGNVSEDPSTATRTLSFTLTDGDGGSVQSIATSSVLQAEDPAFATDDSAATDENQTVAGSVLGNDGDVDGPAPQVGQVNGSSTDVGQLITLGSGAKLQLNADGSYVYDPNGAFDYLVDPDSGAAGTTSAIDSFTYGLVAGGTATVTITVGGVNLAGEALYGDSGGNDIDGAFFADLFRLEQGGADSASGLDGDDVFYFGAAFGPDDQVDGGSGTDTVAIQGDYSGGLVLGTGTTSNMAGVESLSLLSGANTQFGDLGGNLYDYVITTLDSNVAAGVQFKINGGNLLVGEDLTVDGSAETNGHFLIYGGKGVDLLTGGAGNDVFFFAHDGRLGAGDHVDGGTGIDGLFLRGNFTIDFNDAAYSDLVRNVENFTLTSVADTRYARSADTEFDYDIITDDALVAAGLTVTFNGGQLQASETMKLDASHETDGHLRIFAGASNDILIGGAGNDLLFGGLGADMLDGGAGSDTLRYGSAAESTGLAHDVLVGFDYSVDRLDLAGTHDSFESLNGGQLDTASFDADLASAMNGVLGVNEVVFFTADSGDRAGSNFLIVDQNGIAGYQAGQDYVFDVTASPPPLGPPPDFIV
ncbi:MAG TPA: Ig-like domain-containing protein [Allosphingosinicella sp.]